MAQRRAKDATSWIMSDLTSRIVAESGIPTDRYHLGKMVLRSFRDHPYAILQIDGATGESDTNASVLEKSVKCATCFQNFGLGIGDVIVLMGANHLTLAVPFYAALYTGVIVSAVDRTLGIEELQAIFKVNEPKIIFCQSEKAHDVQVAINKIDLDATIVIFDKGDNFCSFSEFIEKYEDNTPVENFKATDFDAENTTAFLVPTSGTTSLPKSAEVLHKNMAIALPVCMSLITLLTPTTINYNVSPLQWLTTHINFLTSVIFKLTRLQSSINLTQEHACYLINTYKPSYATVSPSFFTFLANAIRRGVCDLSCFEYIWLGGSAVYKDIVNDIKILYPKIEIINIYGMSELTSVAFYGSNASPESCGLMTGPFQYRIVDIEMMKDIKEPKVPGELWLKGPTIFKGYYKDSKATEEAFADDGWFKTGDLFYRDENSNFFFLDRIKLLLKYKNNQVSPVEVENVIRKHPGVSDVAVTGIPDPECGDLAIACVVKREGWDVTADDIKLLVKDSLSDTKQLRGGVIFIKSIPMIANTKVHQRKLKQLVLSLQRQ